MEIDKTPNLARGIRNSRILRNMSATELCRLANIPKSSLSDWENGKTSPSGKSFLRLMEALKLSALQIVANGNLPPLDENRNYPYTTSQTATPNIDEIKEDFCQLTERQKETVRNVIKAQLGISSNEKIVSMKLFNEPACAGDGNYISSGDYEIVEFSNPPKTAEFAVKAQGDSMLPKIENGDILYINPHGQVNDGDLGIFTYQGNTFVKQLKHINGKMFLHSLNPKYNDIPIEYIDEFYINGRVL